METWIGLCSVKDIAKGRIYMGNSRRFSGRYAGRYIGTLSGAILSLALWLIPHPPYSFFLALAISLLPLVFGFFGNYVQRKYFPESETNK